MDYRREANLDTIDRSFHREPPPRDHIAAVIETNDSHWGRWFEGNGIAPLEIAYEDLDRHPARTVNDVLEHLGVRADVTLTQPAVKRQADRLTEQYVEQYRSLEDLS